jgi:hypothetical protein
MKLPIGKGRPHQVGSALSQQSIPVRIGTIADPAMAVDYGKRNRCERQCDPSAEI